VTMATRERLIACREEKAGTGNEMPRVIRDGRVTGYG
jgi:hypothetical protein